MLKEPVVSEYEQSVTGNMYFSFGDSQRMYEILSSRDRQEENRHDFEIRVEGDPNRTYVDASVTVPEETSQERIFVHELALAMEQVGAMIDGPVNMTEEQDRWNCEPGEPVNKERYRDGLRHLHEALEEAKKVYEARAEKVEAQSEENGYDDFTDAVNSLGGQDMEMGR